MKLMPIGELAKRIAMGRDGLARKLRREGVETELMPIVTPRGIRDTIGVPMRYARSLIQKADQARKNTAAMSD